MADASADFDADMMRRAIRLAMRGRGRVEPNPMVGCVLVKDGRVIGEGFHERYGGPHAEPTALGALTESAEGATAYVTLEPCCHANKKTPPCVPALIAAKVARVVVGSADPNPDVNGKGLDQLRAAGVAVETGVLGEPAKQLLAPFVARTVYDRPYVTLKWAETADGKVAGAGGRRVQISNERSRAAVHGLRSRCDAIVVGIDTVLADDPLLTVRVDGVTTPTPETAVAATGSASAAPPLSRGPTPRPNAPSTPPPTEPPSPRRLIRVVLDTGLNIPLAAKLVRTAREHRTFVFFAADLIDAERDKIRALRDGGVEPIAAEVAQRGLKLEPILTTLAGFGVTHALVECGPRLARGFFDMETLADRLWLIRSPIRMNEPTAPAGAGVPANFVKTAEIDLAGDRLTEYLNPLSPVFFAAEPSADFEIVRAAR